MASEKIRHNTGRGCLQLMRDQTGNVLPIFAAALVPLVAVIGAGVDVSRTYMVKTRLQQACDAGVLAGRKAVGSSASYTTSAKARATAFFNANFKSDYQSVTDLSFDSSSPNNGSTINGEAEVVVPMAIMQVVGKQNIPLHVNCTATMDVANADITMVLDTTGSMAWNISNGTGGTTTRIAALRAAMKNFYDTMAAAASTGNARIRYAFVPYSTTVNIGYDIAAVNSDFMDSTHNYESRVPVWRYQGGTVIGYENPQAASSTTYSNPVYGNWQYVSTSRVQNKNSCINSMPADANWSNYGTETSTTTTSYNSSGQQVVTTTYTQPQNQQYQYGYSYNSKNCDLYRRTNTRYEYRTTVTTSDPIYQPGTGTPVFDHWLYKEVEYDDLSDYIAGNPMTTENGNNGAEVDYTWAGCVEERDTVASGSIAYNNLTGWSPSGLDDLDIDAIPANSEEGWRPYFNQIMYYRYTSSSKNNYTSSNSLYGNPANSFCPTGAQLLTEMSETAFDNYADSLVANGSTYHDIGAIWGGRVSSPDGIFAANVNEDAPNNGYVSRHVIFMTDGEMAPTTTVYSSYGLELWDKRVTGDGSSNQDARHTARFNAVCEAIKAKGIRVWVIAFSTGLTTSLSNCASPNSAFTSTNAAELNTAFSNIANTIADLRISQ